MSLWSKLHEGFLDAFALVAPSKNGGSTNGVMYTAEAVVIAKRIAEFDDVWRTYWIDVMKPCELGDGVLRRTPTDTNEEAPDDYYGYLAAAKIADPKRARAFLWHGVKNFGFYNSDGKRAWSDCLWRQPQMITHALWAAGFWVGPFRIFFIGSLLYAIRQNKPAQNTDARRLGWLLIQNWDGKGIVSKWAVKRWTDWLFATYPNGMKGVATIYYGPGHPFIEFIPKI